VPISERLADWFGPTKIPSSAAQTQNTDSFRV
jgi:hypothetical protein